ncbi:hypothetical protein RJT34_09789 [Clitoria ternatea]|uniref:Uncharacterized protein n=1 Tax=Clitoria ternatea TaxID=43366 RepID=A0AAN9K7A1_CLITE
MLGKESDWRILSKREAASKIQRAQVDKHFGVKLLSTKSLKLQNRVMDPPFLMQLLSFSLSTLRNNI